MDTEIIFIIVLFAFAGYCIVMAVKGFKAKKAAGAVSATGKPSATRTPGAVTDSKLQGMAAKVMDFAGRTQKNPQVQELVRAVTGVSEAEAPDPYNNLVMLMLQDYYYCLRRLTPGFTLDSPEAFPMLYLVTVLVGRNVIPPAQMRTHRDKYMNAVSGLVESLEKLVAEAEAKKAGLPFICAYLLEQVDPSLRKQYLAQLYLYAGVVSMADGVLTDSEQATMNFILSMSTEDTIAGVTKEAFEKSGAPASATATAHTSATTGQSDAPRSSAAAQAQPAVTLEAALARLDELVGLTGIKQEIHQLVRFLQVQQKRKEAGMNPVPISYHAVFVGNPGTGKTTVARILADIYRALGVVTKGHLVETDRSGLIAEYSGQTAVKVNRTVDSALDGILFIDEAYALEDGPGGGYGKEAVAALIKRIEDDRDRLVVILAGYTDEMRSFIDVNPGFKSRFNRYIRFEDYEADDLVEIFLRTAAKHQYEVSEGARRRLLEGFRKACRERDQSFGNARLARNVFEKSIEKHAMRVARADTFDEKALVLIAEEDIAI